MTVTIATYLWSPDAGSKFAHPYTPDDVRLLQRMVARNLAVPHRFAVITDSDAFTYDRDIDAVAIHRGTHVPGTCFVRLMTFHPDMRAVIGERILQLDLDTMIVGNIDHLVNRDEDLVLWRNPARLPWADFPDAESRKAFIRERCPPGLLPDFEKINFREKSIAWRDEKGNKGYLVNQLRTHYNTSILYHRCGTRPEIWRNFDPKKPPAKDDQWYLSDLFGMDCPYFDGARDGVYRLPRDDTPDPLWVDGKLPANACVVTFPGSNGKASDPRIRAANPWIEEHRL